MKYRNVNFEVDLLGVDTWRWSILPRRATDLTLIGQARGIRDQAVAYCMAEIDAMLERETTNANGCRFQSLLRDP
jgi:hypothetical protein